MADSQVWCWVEAKLEGAQTVGLYYAKFKNRQSYLQWPPFREGTRDFWDPVLFFCFSFFLRWIWSVYMLYLITFAKQEKKIQAQNFGKRSLASSLSESQLVSGLMQWCLGLCRGLFLCSLTSLQPVSNAKDSTEIKSNRGINEADVATQGPQAPSPHFRIIAAERRERLGLSSLPLSYVTVALESFPHVHTS